MTVPDDITEALQVRGIVPEAPLVPLHPRSHIWSDQRTLVVKASEIVETRYKYLADLEFYAEKGVRGETPLLDEVFPVGDLHAIVVRYLEADRATLASDAEAVGALLRQFHDAELGPDPRDDVRVTCPDEWQAEHIVIHDGLPYLVDIDMFGDHDRSDAISLVCHDFLRDLEHTEADEVAFYRGYGPWRTEMTGATDTSTPPGRLSE